MKFKQFLNEEPLNPEHQEKFEKMGKDVGYQNRYNDLFGEGNDRIYFKVTGTVKPKEKSESLDFIEDLIYTYLYNNYDNDYGYKTDYDKDLVTIYKNSTYKTVKKLTFEKLIDLSHERKDGEKELHKNMIKNYPNKKEYNDVTVVISRNPCDIAGMSTNRGWRSCMNLYTGIYKHKVEKDVEHGTLVVYLIDSDDKEIVRPLGRMLIKPHVKGKKTVLRLTDKTYGAIFPKDAIDKIEEWLLEKQPKAKHGFYRAHKDLYDDEKKGKYFFGKQEDIKVGDRVKVRPEFTKLKSLNFYKLPSGSLTGTVLSLDKLFKEDYIEVEFDGLDKYVKENGFQPGWIGKKIGKKAKYYIVIKDKNMLMKITKEK
jgi:hypothetical protein